MKKNIRNTLTIILLAFIFNLTSVRAQCRIDTILYYNFDPGSTVKKLIVRTINKYNASNSVLEILDQSWNSSFNIWENTMNWITLDINPIHI